MYTKYGFFAEAHSVFKTLPLQNIVYWTTRISRYARNKWGVDARISYLRVDLDGLSLNSVASIRAIEKGQEMYNSIYK